jgi:hypothetical protein
MFGETSARRDRAGRNEPENRKPPFVSGGIKRKTMVSADLQTTGKSRLLTEVDQRQVRY